MHAGGYVEGRLESERKNSEIVVAAAELLEQLAAMYRSGKFRPNSETSFCIQKLETALRKI